MSQPLFSQLIPYYADWSLGDSYDFKITKIKQLWKDSKLVSNDSVQFLSNFCVIDSCDSTYTIKWSLKKNIVDTYEVPEKIMQENSEFKTPVVIYKTNNIGQFLDIENWDSLGTIMNMMLNETVNSIAANSNTDSDTLFGKMKSLIPILKSKEGIEKLVFNELILFHYPFGAILSTKKPIRYKDTFPNMLGGKPMPCKVKISVESVDFDSSRCLFLHEVTLNPKYAKNFLIDVLKSFGMDNEYLKSSLKNLKYNLTDYDRFDYYFYPGIPIKIDTKRTMILNFPNNSLTKIEKIRIELVNKQNVL